MATYSLLNLSMKTSFSVAVTSAQRVGERGDLMVDSSFIMFLKEKVLLCPYPNFLPMVVHSSRSDAAHGNAVLSSVLDSALKLFLHLPWAEVTAR